MSRPRDQFLAVSMCNVCMCACVCVCVGLGKMYSLLLWTALHHELSIAVSSVLFPGFSCFVLLYVPTIAQRSGEVLFADPDRTKYKAVMVQLAALQAKHNWSP